MRKADKHPKRKTELGKMVLKLLREWGYAAKEVTKIDER